MALSLTIGVVLLKACISSILHIVGQAMEEIVSYGLEIRKAIIRQRFLGKRMVGADLNLIENLSAEIKIPYSALQITDVFFVFL